MSDDIPCIHEPISTLEFLRRSRDMFRAAGGVTMTLVSDGRVCAMGAMNLVCTGDANDWHVHPDASIALGNTARELYGITCMADVNDSVGPRAVLECFSHAIKLLEEQPV